VTALGAADVAVTGAKATRADNMLAASSGFSARDERWFGSVCLRVREVDFLRRLAPMLVTRRCRMEGGGECDERRADGSLDRH
jgi:hypothetical protein